jgi:hypothetical protein
MLIGVVVFWFSLYVVELWVLLQEWLSLKARRPSPGIGPVIRGPDLCKNALGHVHR